MIGDHVYYRVEKVKYATCMLDAIITIKIRIHTTMKRSYLYLLKAILYCL